MHIEHIKYLRQALLLTVSESADILLQHELVHQLVSLCVRLGEKTGLAKKILREFIILYRKREYLRHISSDQRRALMFLYFRIRRIQQREHSLLPLKKRVYSSAAVLSTISSSTGHNTLFSVSLREAVDASVALGHAYRRLGQWDRAAETFTQALATVRRTANVSDSTLDDTCMHALLSAQLLRGHALVLL